MADIAYVASGAASSANAGANPGPPAPTGSVSVTPGKPAGVAVNHIMIASVYAVNPFDTANPPADFSTPSGWTAITNVTNTAAYSGCRHKTYWRRVDGSEGATFTFTSASNCWGMIARIAAFSGCKTSGSPINASSAQVDNAFNDITAPSITPSVARCMIVLMPAGDQMAAGPNHPNDWQNHSGANPAFVEAFDSYDNSQFDSYYMQYDSMSIALAYGIRTTADATGDRFSNSFWTGDFGFNEEAQSAMIALEPAIDPFQAAARRVMQVRRRLHPLEIY